MSRDNNVDIHHAQPPLDPSNDFNACDDFFHTVVICYVLVASMQILGMDSLTDVPTAEEFGFSVDSWMNSDITHRSEMYLFHATQFGNCQNACAI